MPWVALERQSRNALAAVLGALFPVRKCPPESVRQALESGSARKILLLRPHQGLGDLLLATPIFRALKEAYPLLEIHFLADTYNVGAIRRNRYLDKIWLWDKKAMRYPWRLFRFLRTLRAEKYAIAAALSSHVPSFTSFLLARFTGAEVVWGYDTHPFYGGAHWSRHLAHVEIPVPGERTPEYEKFMSLIRPLLPSPPLRLRRVRQDVVAEREKGGFTPEFFVPQEARAWAAERWNGYPQASGRLKIGIFLGGNPERPERLWPAERWAHLARRFLADQSLYLLAIVPPQSLRSGSGAPEAGMYPQVVRLLHEDLPRFAGVDLDKDVAFLSGLDLFICPDGGLMHAAIAARVPTLGLFFGTDPARWLPPVAWAKAVRAPDGRPVSLSVETVAQAALSSVDLTRRI